MKKIYIKPMAELIISDYESFICTSGGGAGEQHGGGTDGGSDSEGGNIGGTGKDDDFDQGAKGGAWNGWDD